MVSRISAAEAAALEAALSEFDLVLSGVGASAAQSVSVNKEFLQRSGSARRSTAARKKGAELKSPRANIVRQQSGSGKRGSYSNFAGAAATARANALARRSSSSGNSAESKRNANFRRKHFWAPMLTWRRRCPLKARTAWITRQRQQRRRWQRPKRDRKRRTTPARRRRAFKRCPPARRSCAPRHCSSLIQMWL